MKGSHLATIMRKALAQNPNLLRTIIGMGLTLIFLLAYAVYGATMDTEVYIYHSDSEQTEIELDDVEKYYDENSNQTTWTWDAELNGVNLTWINLTADSLSSGSVISISNAAGFYGHPDLGNPDADEFSCANSCVKSEEHRVNMSGESTSIITLTDPDPALRGTSSLTADSLKDATSKAKEIIETNFEPTSIRITIIEDGNRTVNPSVSLTQVNEQYSGIEQFELDTATEFIWALAAVIGCFSLVLVPSFTVYFAARAKQKRLEVKLELTKISIEEE